MKNGQNVLFLQNTSDTEEDIIMTHDIFISYSRKDLKQVIAIRDEIKEIIGANSWIDIKGIESGEQFVNVIIRAIDDAKVVLFMISASSMQSEYTKKEIMYAKNIGKKIVPIILDNSQLSGWFLFEFGTVDYVNINDPMHKQKFHENLKSWLGLDNNGQGPQDLFDVGLHYYLKQDYTVAFDWFMKAASFEYAEAQYYIGICYNEGIGVALDYSKAMEWYLKASKQEHADAQKKIGILYKYGWGVPHDEAMALEWYKKAAGNGNLMAQYEIGKCYYYGRSVEIDYAEAIKWFLMTAEAGLVNAQSSLGYCYFRGEGVERDYRKAVKWLRKAAEKGTPGAQYHMGVCYYHGLGVGQDFAKAIYWFKQATKKNHAASEYHLGLCYLNGYGVLQDEAEADVCFRKALKQGYEEAKKYLRSPKNEQLTKKLRPTRIKG